MLLRTRSDICGHAKVTVGIVWRTFHSSTKRSTSLKVLSEQHKRQVALQTTGSVVGKQNLQFTMISIHDVCLNNLNILKSKKLLMVEVNEKISK